MNLSGKTIFISGASRGIGLAIAKRAASDGANVAIAAKTAEPNPKLPGTIHSAAQEIEAAGGRALALQVDIREEAQVVEAARQAAETFGGIDILINNASAINLTPTEATPMKRFDLMMGVNTRGTFLCTQACLPYLKQAGARKRNPHVLTLSPPLNMDPRWVIATAALQMIPGVKPEHCRSVDIMADAAYAILTMDAAATGNFFIDDEVLARAGITDLAKYSVVPGSKQLMPDLFL